MNQDILEQARNNAATNASMNDDTPQKLAALLARERESLMSNWRRQVRNLASACALDNPSLNNHMPAFIDDLAAALASGADQTIPDAVQSGNPSAHGLQRVEEGFDIEEVVAEYGVLRGCVHDLADLHGINVRGTAFHILNVVLDGAISVAVQTYASQRALEVQKRREEYLAFVAHDLRTPLNAISLAARVLERTVPAKGAEPAQLQMLNALRRNVEHLDRLVHTVLQENGAGASVNALRLERRTLDVWPLVEATIHELRPVADRVGTLLINATPEDLVVFADADLLRRIFQNLVANAIAHTPQGEVTIGAREVGVQGAECWVSDNGAGIARDRLEEVFDTPHTELLQLDRGRPALGLAIVKTFVAAHGGELEVESSEGFGSTFRFRLAARGVPAEWLSAKVTSPREEPGLAREDRKA